MTRTGPAAGRVAPLIVVLAGVFLSFSVVLSAAADGTESAVEGETEARPFSRRTIVEEPFGPLPVYTSRITAVDAVSLATPLVPSRASLIHHWELPRGGAGLRFRTEDRSPGADGWTLVVELYDDQEAAASAYVDHFWSNSVWFPAVLGLGDWAYASDTSALVLVNNGVLLYAGARSESRAEILRVAGAVVDELKRGEQFVTRTPLEPAELRALLQDRFGPLPEHEELISSLDVEGLAGRFVPPGYVLQSRQPAPPPEGLGVAYEYAPAEGAEPQDLLRLQAGVFGDPAQAAEALTQVWRRTTSLAAWQLPNVDPPPLAPGLGDRAFLDPRGLLLLLVNNVAVGIHWGREQDEAALRALGEELAEELTTGATFVTRGPTAEPLEVEPFVREQ